jgi:hypothetical protein
VRTLEADSVVVDVVRLSLQRSRAMPNTKYQFLDGMVCALNRKVMSVVANGDGRVGKSNFYPMVSIYKPCWCKAVISANMLLILRSVGTGMIIKRV